MKKELELYIHIPFCERKCNYCDFLSFPTGESTRRAYVSALINELKYMAFGAGDYSLRSIFIGGGTPSILAGSEIERIMETVNKYFYIREDAEISIECNPNSLSLEKLKAYRDSGINRISIGLQSANENELKALGRLHTYGDFLNAYEAARKAGFNNINIDLINYIPCQSASSWERTLRQVLLLKPTHLSIYNLIVEEGTPFYKLREEGHLMLPTEDEETLIDEVTMRLTASHGLNRYEFSNYAHEGYECIHNIGYWERVPYIGVGLGASSFYKGHRMKNTPDIDRYMDIDFYGDPEDTESKLRAEDHELSLKEAMEEFVFLGLRMIRGISTREFLCEFGRHIETVFGEQLSSNMEKGLIIYDNGHYRLSERGIDVSNIVLSEFIID